MRTPGCLCKGKPAIRGPALSSDKKSIIISRLLPIVMMPPDSVRWKKSSLTFGYASKLLSLLRKPSMLSPARVQRGALRHRPCFWGQGYAASAPCQSLRVSAGLQENDTMGLDVM